MKKKEAVFICLRIMGIFYFLAGLSFIPHLLENLTTSKVDQWSFFVSPLLQLVIGCFLYTKASQFSYYIVDCSEDNESYINLNVTSKTMKTALQLLGFYILAIAIPHFFQILINVVAYNLEISTIPKHLRQIQQHWRYIAEPTLKIIIGFWLIFGINGIIKIMSRFDHTFNELDRSNHANSADAKSRAAD